MKKIIVLAAVVGMLYGAPQSASAHENPVEERRIISVLVWPFEVVFSIAALPFQVVGGIVSPKKKQCAAPKTGETE